MRGPAEREFDRMARRYAAAGRLVATVGCGSLGLLLVPAGKRPSTGVALILLITWSWVYGRLIQRTSWCWPVLADLAFLCTVSLTEASSVPAASILDGCGWLLALVSMAVVTYQWHTSISLGALAAAALVGAYLIGTRAAVLTAHGNETPWLSTTLWLLVEGLVSRGVYLLVRRGARVSDEYLARRERDRLAGAVSRARRSDELSYLAALHDTAAATFLIIGSGAITARPGWVAEQARRDLRVLRSDDGQDRTTAANDLVDLTAMMVDLLAEVEVSVSHDLWRKLLLPSRPAEAIRDSVREALTNVARHTDTGRAAVSVLAGPRIVVEISDQGAGFDPVQVSPHQRGITESIHARMRRAGGSASVMSAPARGTTIRLEWPDE